MKSSIAKSAIGLTLVLSSGLSSAASVAPNPNGSGNIVFSPSNTDIDILSITDSGVGWDYTLYMFDDGVDLTSYDPNSVSFVNDQNVLKIAPVPAQIEFSGLNVTLSTSPNDALLLTGNQQFEFGLWNHNYGGGTWIEASYANLVFSGIPDIYDIIFQFDNPVSGIEETVVFAVDVVPVPLPAAAWMFGMGIGLLSLVKKRSKS